MPDVRQGDDYDFDFTREDDGVQAMVALPYDITLNLWSSEPSNPREWEIDEISVPTGSPDVPWGARRLAGTQTFTPDRRQQATVYYDCPLGRAITRAWDRYVLIESDLTKGRR